GVPNSFWNMQDFKKIRRISRCCHNQRRSCSGCAIYRFLSGKNRKVERVVGRRCAEVYVARVCCDQFADVRQAGPGLVHVARTIEEIRENWIAVSFNALATSLDFNL